MNTPDEHPHITTPSEHMLTSTKELLKKKIRASLMEHVWAELESPEVLAASIVSEASPQFANVGHMANGVKTQVLSNVRAEVLKQLAETDTLADEMVQQISEQSDVVQALCQQVKRKLHQRVLDMALQEVSYDIEAATPDSLFEPLKQVTAPEILVAVGRPEARENEEQNSATERKLVVNLVDEEEAQGARGVSATSDEETNEESDFRHTALVAPQTEAETPVHQEASVVPLSVGAVAPPKQFALYALLKRAEKRLLETVSKEVGVSVPGVTFVRSGKLVALVQEMGAQQPSLTPEQRDTLLEALRKRIALLPFAHNTTLMDEDGLKAYVANSEIYWLKTLDQVDKRQEWHVSVRRNKERVRQVVVETSDQVNLFVREMKQRPKGIAQFLKSKMVKAINQEIDVTTQNCLNHSFKALEAESEHALMEVKEHATQQDGVLGQFVFLLSNEQEAVFKDVHDKLGEQYTSAGFHFQLSGPLLPYSFVLPEARAAALPEAA